MIFSENDERTPRCRKRLRQDEKHKKTVRKTNKERGKQYKSTSGKVVDEKKFLNVECGCPRKCIDLITRGRRQEIFEHYYSLSYIQKNAFIGNTTQITSIKRKYTKCESRRLNTRIYRFKNENLQYVRVCKKFFKDTIQISDGKITSVLKLRSTDDTPIEDRRGRHAPHNKSDPASVQYLQDFINSIPAYNSHYSRKDNEQRKYLAPDLSMKILYDLYGKKCEQENKIPLSLFVFRHIFNTKFNLYFHRPQTDTCQMCDRLNASIKGNSNTVDTQKYQIDKELHLRKAEAAKESRRRDIAMAVETGSTKVLIFDLQKTLPTPVLSTGVAYYKRQLWTYNLCVHDEITKTGYMYVWNEAKASRGAQEVGSCLIQHIQKFVPVNTKKIIFYSDSCGGQNRNIKITLLLAHLLDNSENLETIDLKFFIPGHSFSSCDQNFAIIEKAKKFHPNIFLPDHWVDMIASSKKSEPRFVVQKMAQENFVASTTLEQSITNRKNTIEKEKVSWLNIRWIRLEKGQPKIIKFKTTHQDDTSFLEIDVTKKSRGRQGKFGNIPLDLLYPNGRKIEKKKLGNLHELLGYIPPIYHDFYLNINADEDDVEDNGLYGEETEEGDNL